VHWSSRHPVVERNDLDLRSALGFVECAQDVAPDATVTVDPHLYSHALITSRYVLFCRSSSAADPASDALAGELTDLPPDIIGCEAKSVENRSAALPEAPKRSMAEHPAVRSDIFHQPRVAPRLDSQARLHGLRQNLSRYASSWASKTSVQGMETRRMRNPAALAALTASAQIPTFGGRAMGARRPLAWVAAIEHKGLPWLVSRGRHCLKQQRTPQQKSDAARGGYVLIDCEGTAQWRSDRDGFRGRYLRRGRQGCQRSRCCASPGFHACTEVFDRQDEAYRESVLPKAVKARLAVEAGATLGWWKYCRNGRPVLGIDRFGRFRQGR